MRIKKYKYYLFDLDRTLWNFDANAGQAFFRLIEKTPRLKETLLNKKPLPEQEALNQFFDEYEVNNIRLWKEYESGIIEKDFLRWRRFYEPMLPYGIDDEPLARQMGEQFLEEMVIGTELMPGAMELLTTLKNEGATMAILSNGFTEVQYRKLKNSGLAPFFKAVVLSEEVGVHKPSPEIYRIALERLSGLHKESDSAKWDEAKKECVMVGDDYGNDIDGAKLFGIDQIYYNPKHKPYQGEATYELSDLREYFEV